MTAIATFFGYASGLLLVAPHLDVPALVGTAIGVQICHAVMCYLIARNNGHPKGTWTVAGLIVGLWAVLVLVVLPRRTASPPPPRPLP
jgi:hypothetical protein